MRKPQPRPAAASTRKTSKTRVVAPAPEPPPARDGHRRHRARPTPSWLLEQRDLDEIARRRCLMVLSVLSGETPVTDAIASSSISRQLYYQLEERALKAMLKALTPGSEAAPITGPDAASLRRIGELEMKVKQLEQDKRRTDRLLYLTRKVVAPGPLTTGGRGRPPKARLVSADDGPRPAPAELRDDELARTVESLVRQSRGLFGADSLSAAVPGISRREAAAIKAATLTEMEAERKRSLDQVIVTEPGIIRGFDAMYVCTTDGMVYALCAGDACVPYTTSIAIAERYDSPAVAAALDEDFCENGAPLVLRMDRAACHKTDEVAAVCLAHGVLVLHGPPRHPRFYGQLERQNRDRRVWLNHGPRPPPSAIASDLERQRVFLNSAWRRRSLGFLTAEERWKRRQIPCLDRTELRNHVDELTARFSVEAKTRAYDGLARRLAIELALTQRGYLRQSRREAC